MASIFLYLDPGAGSMLVQLIIAGFLGVATFYKNIKLYVKAVFLKSKPSGNVKAK